MKRFIIYFLLFVFCAGTSPEPALAEQTPNPRSGAAARAESRDVKRTGEQASRAAVRRQTTVSRPAAASAQGVVSNRAAARSVANASGRTNTPVARTANVSRAAVSNTATARSAAPLKAASSVSRSARATAIFDDVSKIGTGYSACRDAYSTCMDQFCAKANDTFRRCYCSQKYTEFKDTEAALDQAKTLLMQFEDNNLNAVDKTASEVNAMYSATVGEAAIKKDASAAQQVLSEIGDLLSGKKKVEKADSASSMALDFSADIGDIWGGGTNDIFSADATKDLNSLEGLELYNSSDKMCSENVRSACENNATYTMAKSAYNIFISQDCNTYEKKINTQKEAVAKTVREAEKFLREARLDEYRAHNSADVNECLTKVKTAITGPMACGESYNKCLDYTGLYINANTGEPIYSMRLFDLTKIINLNASGDSLQSNPKFNSYLEEKRMFAETALDTCRDKTAIVWEEFKRQALIEIAQSQDEKIEEVKSGCVGIMKECYDAQSGALASFDTTNAQASGALNAAAARAMCKDKVIACANLYSEPGNECEFDNNGRLTSPTCGLSALLTFVSTVDNVKIAEGCETGLTNYVEKTCAPAGGDAEHKSPYGCRLRNKTSIGTLLQNFALQNCYDPSSGKPSDYASFMSSNPTIGTMIDTSLNKILEDIDYVLYDECEKAEGVWLDLSEYTAQDSAEKTKFEMAFYTATFNGKTPATTGIPADNDGSSWGYCMQNTVLYQCRAQDEATGGVGHAKFNAARNICEFDAEWYKTKCEEIGGYYENSVCYV
ncbi:MAG: hypothetical protein LBD50_00065 [Rickettsiales bacterium]|jgi:hypothetical protein|nr:hypothetical protein [Rickettsiales bacterium]